MGLVLGRYYSGDEKGAKNLFHAIKKTYPQFITSSELKQLPLSFAFRLRPCQGGFLFLLLLLGCKFLSYGLSPLLSVKAVRFGMRRNGKLGA